MSREHNEYRMHSNSTHKMVGTSSNRSSTFKVEEHPMLYYFTFILVIFTMLSVNSKQKNVKVKMNVCYCDINVHTHRQKK